MKDNKNFIKVVKHYNFLVGLTKDQEMDAEDLLTLVEKTLELMGYALNNIIEGVGDDKEMGFKYEGGKANE